MHGQYDQCVPRDVPQDSLEHADGGHARDAVQKQEQRDQPDNAGHRTCEEGDERLAQVVVHDAEIRVGHLEVGIQRKACGGDGGHGQGMGTAELLYRVAAQPAAGKEEKYGEVAFQPEGEPHVVPAQQPAGGEGDHGDCRHDDPGSAFRVPRQFLNKVKNQAHGVQREHEPQRAPADRRLPGHENLRDVPADVILDVRYLRVDVHDHHARGLGEQVEVVDYRVKQHEQQRERDVRPQQHAGLVDKVTAEVAEAPRAEQHARYEEECGHAERAQVQHPHGRARERLLHVIEAHEQQHESLELVNPPDASLRHGHSLEPHLFVVDGSERPVAREHDGVSGERQYLGLDAAYEGILVAAEKVGTAPAARKEDVAREQYRDVFAVVAGVLAVEGEPSGGMPRHVDYAQLDSRHLDGVAVGKVAAQRRGRVVEGQAEHVALLLLQAKQERVGLVGLRLHAVGALHERVAEDMVQVQVRVQHAAHLEAGILYIGGEGGTFALVARAGVHEYGIPRTVAQYVGVHAEGIKDELLDLHAVNVEKRGNYNGKTGKKEGEAAQSTFFQKKVTIFQAYL